MLTLLLSALLTAHPGHGSMALVGTLVAVTAESITLDVRDVASSSTRRVVVTTTADTRLLLGKQAVATLDGWSGASVVVTVNYEEDVNGRTVYTADKVQITPAKLKRR